MLSSPKTIAERVGLVLAHAAAIDRGHDLQASVPAADLPNHFVDLARAAGGAQAPGLLFSNTTGRDILLMLATKRSCLLFASTFIHPF